MVKYESKIIYDFAERLYSRAWIITALYTLTGAILGVIGFILEGYYFGWKLWPIYAGTTVLLIVIGYIVGDGKAFWIKLQAQIALCQVKIEENTGNITSERKAEVSIFQKITPQPIGQTFSDAIIKKNSKVNSKYCPQCAAEIILNFCQDCGQKVS